MIAHVNLPRPRHQGMKSNPNCERETGSSTGRDDSVASDSLSSGTSFTLHGATLCSVSRGDGAPKNCSWKSGRGASAKALGQD